MRNPVLRRLMDIIEDKLDTVYQVRKSEYENPSWAYLQAHNNGRAEAMEEILELLKFVER